MMYAQLLIVSMQRQCRQFRFKADDLQPGVRSPPADFIEYSRGIRNVWRTGRAEHRRKKLLADGRIASSPDMERQEQAPPVADHAQIMSAAQHGADLVGQLQCSFALARLGEQVDGGPYARFQSDRCPTRRDG